MAFDVLDMNFHQKIRSEFGNTKLQLVKSLEVTSKKVARFKNHLRFLRCKQNSITPINMKIKSNVKGTKAGELLKRTEKSLLNIRIT